MITAPAVSYHEHPETDDNDEVIITIIPAGVIVAYGGAAEPSGWGWCDGTEISRATYVDLWVAIGPAYGAGDGTTTFNKPNLCGRVPVGLKSTDADFDTLGETGGAKTHVNNIDPPNTESTTPSGTVSVGGTGTSVAGPAHKHNTNIAAFDSAAANHMNPYQVANYIIKY